MCTCINLKNKYFGRTLDLDRHAKEEAVITPRNYEFITPVTKGFKTKYAIIGTAMVIGNLPLYYEGCNELGLAMAGLNFPINCKYNEEIEGKLNLAVFELIPYILGRYGSIKELRKDLENLNITNVSFHEKLPSSPLHYMLVDKEESIIIEQTDTGLHIYQNEVGVMTNNPSFDIQLENLKKYTSLTPNYLAPKDPKFTCVGLGSVGLPGDYSSMSRFVKANFLVKNAEVKNNEEDISTFFHILDGVSMIPGTVINKDKRNDLTFYSSCYNLEAGIYYYKTYNNNQISVLKLEESNMNSSTLTRYELICEQQFNYLNK